MADKSLLSSEEDAFMQQLVLPTSGSGEVNLFPDQKTEAEPLFTIVEPEPVACIKTKNDEGDKVFLNICKTSQMPSPQDITEEELVALLDLDAPDYRIPMSIGEPHAELDKSGKGCTAYDVMISDEFMAKIQKSHIFNGFFMTVVMEGLENKFDIKLDRNWTQLKNRKCLGKLHEHRIRASSKPRIQEMASMYPSAGQEGTRKQLISEVTPSAVSNSVEPECLIVQEPKTGYPEFLVAEVKLPKVKSSRTIDLDLGEDRILLKAHPELYTLDLYLPYDVIQEDSGAQFNRDTKVLTLTLPVKPA